MKKITLFSLVIALLFAINTKGQGTLYFRISNAKVMQEEPARLQFDIEMKSDKNWCHKDLQVSFFYNEQAFGSSIVQNGKITMKKLDLMKGHSDGMPLYNIVNSKDIPGSGVVFFTELTSQDGCNKVTEEYTGLVRISIDIENASGTAGVRFNDSFMDSGQYYSGKYNVPEKYGKVILENDLKDFSVSK